MSGVITPRTSRPIVVGDIIHGFRVLRVERIIPDIDASATELVHEATGMRVVKFVPACTEYSESSFVFALKTPPTNDCGLPHICEHCVFNGSKRYPVKDPFYELTKGSLQTSLNAYTAQFHTAFLFSSRVEEDYFNIMDVYLDALASPLLLTDQTIFAQEGWHLHLEVGADGAPTCLEERGIVLNEMKGVYSDPSAQCFHSLKQLLFKDTNLRFESGGHPDKIVTTTSKDASEFYRTYYVPSNTHVFLHGRFSLHKELKFLSEHYLASFCRTSLSGHTEYFTKPAPVLEVPSMDTLRRNAGSFAEVEYSVGDQASLDTEYINSQLLCLYRTADPAVSTVEIMGIRVLRFMLFNMPTSPLPLVMQQLNLASSLDADSRRSGPFAIMTVTGTGCTRDTEAYYRVLNDLLLVLADRAGEATSEEVRKRAPELQNTLNPKSVESTISLIKYMVLKPETGCGLAYSVFDAWLNDQPFDRFLNAEGDLDALEKMAADGSITGYLRGLLSRYMIDNATTVRVLMKPVYRTQEAQEQARRDKRDAVLQAFADKRVVTTGVDGVTTMSDLALFCTRLLAKQTATDSASKRNVPILSEESLCHVDELYDHILHLRCYPLVDGGKNFLYFNTQRVGRRYFYFTLTVNVTPLIHSLNDLHLLALLSNLICVVGTGSYTAAQLQDEMNTLGNVRAYLDANTNVNTGAVSVYLVISSDCLMKNAARMITLVMQEVLHGSLHGLSRTEANAEILVSQIKDIWSAKKSHLQNGPPSGILSDYTLTKKLLHSYIHDNIKGFAYYDFLSALYCRVTKDDDKSDDASTMSNGCVLGVLGALESMLHRVHARPELYQFAVGVYIPELVCFAKQSAFSDDESQYIHDVLVSSAAHAKVMDALTMLSDASFDEDRHPARKMQAPLDQNAFLAFRVGFDEIMDNEPPKSLAASVAANYVTIGNRIRKQRFSGPLLLGWTVVDDFLWNNVRVIGGAYGANARFTRYGVLSITSFRDPHIKETIDMYNKIPAFLANLQLTETEFLKYKIGAISSGQYSLDPESLYNTAIDRYRSGINPNVVRMNIRGIVDCDIETLRAQASMYERMLEGPLVVFGSREQVKRAVEDDVLFYAEDF